MVANFYYGKTAFFLDLVLRENEGAHRLYLLDKMEESKKDIHLYLEKARLRTPFVGSIRFSNIGTDGKIPERYSRTLSGVILTIPKNEGELIIGINLARPTEREYEYLNTTPAPGSRIIFSILVDTSDRERVDEAAKFSGVNF